MFSSEQVNKMNGEIKVVQKSGQGTLMRLYLVLKTPIDTTRQQQLPCQLHIEDHKLTVRVLLLSKLVP